MIFFVAFILLGLTLGVGMMLAPALPTAQPRVAASGVLVFATVLSGALFHAAWFGWDTLLVDYLWFALITGVFLGGTLTVGMHKLEESIAAGEETDSGWPTLLQMGIFLGLGVVMGVVLLVSGVDGLGDSPQLMTRIDAMQRGHSLEQFNTLEGNIGPGVPALLAYFAAQLPANNSQSYGGLIMMGYVLLGWLFFDIGQEIRQAGNLKWYFFGTIMLVGVLLQTSLVALLAVLFVVGFWFYALRWSRHRLPLDAIATAICAAAAVLVHPFAGIAMTIFYAVNLPLLTASQRLTWGIGLLLIPTLTLIGILPWLLTIAA